MVVFSSIPYLINDTALRQQNVYQTIFRISVNKETSNRLQRLGKVKHVNFDSFYNQHIFIDIYIIELPNIDYTRLFEGRKMEYSDFLIASKVVTDEVFVTRYHTLEKHFSL